MTRENFVAFVAGTPESDQHCFLMNEPISSTSPPRLDSATVHALPAHRFPFLLVDEISIEVPGRRDVGTRRISANEWWAGGISPAEGGLVVAADLTTIVRSVA